MYKEHTVSVFLPTYLELPFALKWSASNHSYQMMIQNEGCFNMIFICLVDIGKKNRVRQFTTFCIEVAVKMRSNFRENTS